MKQTVAIIIAGACLANILIFWGTPAVYGWAVAFCGWTAWVLDQISIGNGRGNL